MENWKGAIKSNKVIGILSTDLSKAFDSLHSPILLAKLKAYGFKDGATDLMRSYFSEKWNRVRVRVDKNNDE